MFSGLRYDAGTYARDIKQSVGPGHYMLARYGGLAHCDACMPLDTSVVAGASVLPQYPGGVIVDIESDLHNITRKASRNPMAMYRGDGKDPASASIAANVQAMLPPACKQLPAVDTRLTTPPCTLRGTGWNRWEWLCRDPQDRAIRPFVANVNTGILVKDNHRPHLAKPIDPTLALPPGASAECSPMPVAEPCHPKKPFHGESTAIGWRSCVDLDRIRLGT
jgi:hypothetical protein